MKNRKTTISWISIAVAVASAVGIVFIPEYRLWFLVILLLNMLVSAIFNKQYVNNKRFIKPLTVCRWLIGALFIFSSFTKGVDPLGTKYQMLDYFAAYHLQGLNGAAMVLAVLLILAEFLIGICLLTNVFPKLAVVAGSAFMLMFTTVTLYDALYDKVPDCGCFGTAIKMSNWQTFYKNLVIDAVLLPLVLNLKSVKTRLSTRSQWILGLSYAILFAGFEIYNYRHLPVIDFMPWKVGKQMKPDSNVEQRWYVTYKYKATGEIQEYLLPDMPYAYNADEEERNKWEFVDSRCEGCVEPLLFDATAKAGNDVVDSILDAHNLLLFTSSDMSKITEKEWEKIKNITEEADKADFGVAWIVSEYWFDVEAYQQKYPFLTNVYNGDEREIKTMVRFNPGLIWLDEGVVKNKWSAIDFPQGKKLDKLLHQ